MNVTLINKYVTDAIKYNKINAHGEIIILSNNSRLLFGGSLLVQNFYLLLQSMTSSEMTAGADRIVLPPPPPPPPPPSSSIVVGRFVTHTDMRRGEDDDDDDNFIFMRSEFECYLDGKLNTSYKNAYKMCKPCKPIQIVNIPSDVILKSYVNMAHDSLGVNNGLSDQGDFFLNYFVFIDFAMIIALL